MTKYRVKFIEAAQVEHAHTGKDAGKGGFVIEKIAVGTVVESMTAASVNFWRARGKIEVLGRVDEPKLSAFGTTTVPPKSEDVQPMAKNALRIALETAYRHLSVGDNQELVAALAALDLAAISDPLEPMPDDSRMLLFGAIEDAKNGGPISNIGELGEALLDGADVLLAPSRRKRVKPSD